MDGLVTFQIAYTLVRIRLLCLIFYVTKMMPAGAYLGRVTKKDKRRNWRQASSLRNCGKINFHCLRCVNKPAAIQFVVLSYVSPSKRMHLPCFGLFVKFYKRLEMPFPKYFAAFLWWATTINSVHIPSSWNTRNILNSIC